MTRMDQAALDGVVRLLDLEPIEVNIFRGASPDEDRQRTFGGQVAGQSLVAAARTVDESVRIHSSARNGRWNHMAWSRLAMNMSGSCHVP